MLDVLFKNAMVIDGTGAPAFTANVAVDKGVIVQVAPGITVQAACVVDAAGLTLVPGFVDIHRHGDLTPYWPKKNGGEELRQGITSFINGNCGFSAVPSSKTHFGALCDYALPIMGSIPRQLCGGNFQLLRSQIENSRLYSHTGYLVGNGALRIAVKGFDASPMAPSELEAVCTLLEEDLQAGAFGLSLGLMYVPENYYSTDELVRICRVPARMNRLVTVHMRGEGNSLLESIDEVLEIAEQSGAAFHISHLKAAGKRNWNKLVPCALEKIADARARGLDISFDVYPYRAGSTALYTLLPPALQQDGMPQLLKRLQDKDIRRQTAAQLRQEQTGWDNLIASTGWQSVAVAGGGDVSLYGRDIETIAQQRGTTPEETVFDLLLENNGDVPIVLYSMCEDDMRQVLQAPGAIVISDALYSEKGKPHPRRYGSQARLLARYAAALGVEKAVAAITSLPAMRMGLTSKGRVAAGADADLLLLDMARMTDTATFAEPCQYPTGIVQAYVGGRLAFTEDQGLLDCGGHLLLANKVTMGGR